MNGVPIRYTSGASAVIVSPARNWVAIRRYCFSFQSNPGANEAGAWMFK